MRGTSEPGSIDRLRRDAELALREAADPGAILPLLHRLARRAPDGSEACAFAHRSLAEILVDRDPWRAALHARRATRAQPDDDRGFAALGLCLTLLANYRAAAASYRRALDLAPHNPWYAHNLGHLLDVAIGRPHEALPWLARAYEEARRDGEIATSYAQALARAGSFDEARRVLRRATRRGATREQAALLRWLDAPENERAPIEPARRAGGRVQLRDGADEVPRSVPRRRPARDTVEARRRALERVVGALDVHLGSLPFDEEQRARAHGLASEAVAVRPPPDEAHARALAAAVAYAIVHEDRIPLTPAEIAATFRVSVSSLRGRFSSLRTRLSLARQR